MWQTEAGITPQTCIARREPHYSSTATVLGTTFRIQYRSIQTKVNTLPSSTTKNSLKKAQGCAEGRGLVPLCGFLTFQCDLPSAGFRSPCAIQPKAAAYAAYTADVPQSMRHIRPGFRNPCGHSAGASAAHAVIISPYKI